MFCSLTHHRSCYAHTSVSHSRPGKLPDKNITFFFLGNGFFCILYIKNNSQIYVSTLVGLFLGCFLWNFLCQSASVSKNNGSICLQLFARRDGYLCFPLTFLTRQTVFSHILTILCCLLNSLSVRKEQGEWVFPLV